MTTKCCRTCEHYRAITDKRGQCRAPLPYWVLEYDDGFDTVMASDEPVRETAGEFCKAWTLAGP